VSGVRDCQQPESVAVPTGERCLAEWHSGARRKGSPGPVLWALEGGPIVPERSERPGDVVFAAAALLGPRACLGLEVEMELGEGDVLFRGTCGNSGLVVFGRDAIEVVEESRGLARVEERHGDETARCVRGFDDAVDRGDVLAAK